MTAPEVRVVAIGGGHGLSSALAALRRLDVEPTALVTTADDGGSSGRIRRDLDVIPPGDLRRALLTLARDRRWADVLAHRFSRGELRGHPLGNLLLVSLAERQGGDFVAALADAAALLDCAGTVLPASAVPCQLKAMVAGHEVGGQSRVSSAAGRIERVWLEPEHPEACVPALRAVADADLIVLGPGSLFTSVIAALLVPDLAAAVAATPARVVYIANLRTQPGETSGLDAAAHVEALLAHAPGLHLDTVILHDGPPPRGEGAPLGTWLPPEVGAEVALADVVERRSDGGAGAGHDPARLADVLRPLLRPRAR